jgi:O-antigen/teichoic acid export membrane protein
MIAHVLSMVCGVCASGSPKSWLFPQITMRRLWLQVFHTSGASAVNIAASAAVLFLTARWLGPDGRGVYAAATGWVLLFTTLGSLSLGQSLVHEVAGREHSTWLPAALGTGLAIAGLLIAGNFVFAAAAYVFGGDVLFRHMTPSVLILAFAALPFLVANANLPFVLYALDALFVINIAQVTGAVVLLVGTIVCVWYLDLGVPGALAAFAAGAACTASVAAVYLFKRAGRPQVQWRVARQMLTGSGQLHLNTVGTYLFTQSSVLILNAFRPPSETGEYQLAVQLLTVSLLLSNSFGAVSYNLVANKGADGAWPEHRVLIKQALALVGVVAVIGYVAAPLLIPLVAGRAFEPAVHLYRLLLPALIGATLSALMASQWIGRGLFWQASLVTIAAGVISVACDFALIPAYGMEGAVVSTLVTYAIAFAANGGMAVWIDRRAARREAAVHG